MTADQQEHKADINELINMALEQANQLAPKEGSFKLDDGKPPISLIPREALEQAAHALGFGAEKYSRHGFRAGLKHSRLIDAALRHILKHADGEDLDSESGVTHIGHAIASLAMLAYMVAHKPELDDRWKRE